MGRICEPLLCSVQPGSGTKETSGVKPEMWIDSQHMSEVTVLTVASSWAQDEMG